MEQRWEYNLDVSDSLAEFVNALNRFFLLRHANALPVQ
jgi:hypothetical protein